METSLLIVKPDGVQRGLVGRIVARFEQKGLQIVGMNMLMAPRETLEAHYAEHKEKPFFGDLLTFMSSGPIVAFAVRGDGAVAVARRLIGETDGAKSPGGTIRGDYGMSFSFNLIHGSDSIASAERELGLWFPEGTIDYAQHADCWVYDRS